MSRATPRFALTLFVSALALAGCGKFASESDPRAERDEFFADQGIDTDRTSVVDMLIKPNRDEVGEVNRFIWNAALETLSFLPVQTIDPFTGVITTGYGKPPGGGRAYRATILVTDAALDARSLNVSLQTSGGPVSVDTQRAVEDAILTRARQLRVADLGL